MGSLCEAPRVCPGESHGESLGGAVSDSRFDDDVVHELRVLERILDFF